MADKRETPKKPVKRGRKPKEETINDFCRLCNCALKRKFGDFEKIEYISTENLFKESNRKDCSSRPLAELCEELIETSVVKSDHLSDRVCKPCGRKVRNAHAVKQQVLSVNKANDQAANSRDTERFKRQLPTSVNSPDRSPRFRKGTKSTDIKTCRPPAKKTLFSQSKSVHIEPDADQDKVSSPSSTFGLNEVALSNLNIEELVESTSTEVKVVIVFPSGATETHSSRSFSRETTSLIVNCCREKWKAVANIVVKHEDLRSEAIETVGNTVRKEFKEYCRDKTEMTRTLVVSFFPARFNKSLLAKLNTVNIMLFPKPVGRIAKTSFPFSRSFTAKSCSSFRIILRLPSFNSLMRSTAASMQSFTDSSYSAIFQVRLEKWYPMLTD